MPRALQALALATITAYQLAAFYESQVGHQGIFRQTFGNFFWIGDWHMFTEQATKHTVIRWEGLARGGWETLPMHEWYPARWESGYRWDRPSARRNVFIQRAFLAGACRKAELQATRMVEVRYKRTLGTRVQPVKNKREKILREQSCEEYAPEPGGRRI